MTWRRYHTGPGFFINTHLIFVTVSATIWVYLLLVLTGSTTYDCPSGTDIPPFVTKCSFFAGAHPECGASYAALQNSRALQW